MTNPVRKPRTLRGKNIRRKTGARAQAKQINALSRAVTKINKEQTERIRTVWQINRKSIGTLTSVTPTCYLCPIPYALCDPLGSSPIGDAKFWSDNNMPVAVGQTSYSKSLVFGYSDAAANCNKVYHTGSKIRYQIVTTEPSYSKLMMFLVKPKSKQADQLVIDRQLKGSTAATVVPVAPAGNPGSSAFMIKDVDYTVYTPPTVGGVPTNNDTTFGAEINRKYWDVIYKREITLSHPNATGFSTNVNPSNSDPRNNSTVATGSIRIPAAGVIINKSQATQTVGNKSAGAFENSVLDMRNEQNYTLVLIHNDATADTQTIELSAVINDYYRAVV